MVAHEREARRRDEGGEAGEQLERRQHADLGAISAEVLDAIGELAAGERAEAAEREWWARGVSAEQLSTAIVVRLDADARVEVKAVDVDRATLARGRFDACLGGRLRGRRPRA